MAMSGPLAGKDHFPLITWHGLMKFWIYSKGAFPIDILVANNNSYQTIARVVANELVGKDLKCTSNTVQSGST